MEQWKKIPSFPDYEVSDFGRVRRGAPSNARGNGGRLPAGYPRKLWKKSGGEYLLVTLTRNKTQNGALVHRLVMEAFVGPSSLQVNHKNGNKRDNQLENLEYVDGAANRAHAMHVLNAYSKGSRHPNAKLTEADVIQIKEMIAAGILDRDIAPVFGCTSTNIYYIRKGKAWTHVGRPTPPI